MTLGNMRNLGAGHQPNWIVLFGGVMKCKSLYMALASLLLAFQAANAQGGLGTKFRGLYINMPRAEVGQVHSDEFDVTITNAKNSRLSTVFFRQKHGGARCAYITFDEHEKASHMELYSCFFGADNLDFEQLEAVVKNYGLADVFCDISGVTFNGVAQGVNKRTCSSSLPTGERITISDCDFLLSPNIGVYVLRVEPSEQWR
jgi:hypothetical protein